MLSPENSEGQEVLQTSQSFLQVLHIKTQLPISKKKLENTHCKKSPYIEPPHFPDNDPHPQESLTFVSHIARCHEHCLNPSLGAYVTPGRGGPARFCRPNCGHVRVGLGIKHALIDGISTIFQVVLLGRTLFNKTILFEVGSFLFLTTVLYVYVHVHYFFHRASFRYSLDWILNRLKSIHFECMVKSRRFWWCNIQ